MTDAKMNRAAVIVVLACLAAAPAGATGVASSFDADNEGWQVVDYPFHASAIGPRTMSALAYDAAFGNPAGSVRVGDIYGETGIAAPAAFLGNKGAFYDGSLAWDILIRYSDNVAYPAVVLSGATMSLYYDAAPPVLGAWTRMSVRLSETGWKVGGTGAAPTKADFEAVLHALAGVYLYTEWKTGPDDTSVDNVVMSAGATPVEGTPDARLALGCYPNPFNPQVTLQFELATEGRARLEILDVDGRLVRTLVDESRPAGRNDVVWNGRDEAGRQVASGAYMARLAAGAGVRVQKIIMVK